LEEYGDEKRWFLVVLAIIAIMSLLLLAGCVAGPNPALGVADTAGENLRLLGRGSGMALFHLLPLLFHLFTKNVNVL